MHIFCLRCHDRPVPNEARPRSRAVRERSHRVAAQCRDRSGVPSPSSKGFALTVERAITYGFNSETESIRLVVETIDATRRD